MENLYKKFGVKEKGAKPGELLEKARARKFKAIRHKKRKMTQAEDDAYDRKHGIKEGSARDIKQDAKEGIKDKKHRKLERMTIHTGEKQDNERTLNLPKSHSMCKMCGKKHPAGKHAKKHGKNWISGAIKHPGALHRQLGVKAGHKIPAGKLRAAAKKGGVIGRRARLAETLKGFHPGK